jgi:16S rRNA (guanine527-N7)-methyltransferase
MEYLQEIEEYLAGCGFNIKESQLEQLAAYQHFLMEANQMVNLISRKASSKDIWLLHILDSLLIIKEITFQKEAILDFGTGGGLPGIPIKILFPETRMYLLDSRNKKMDAIRNILKKLDLPDCFPITSRLEELENSWFGYFDVILSRSVRQKKTYKQAMERLLTTSGRILLYKSHQLDDLVIFPKFTSYDISHPLVGTRKLIEIKKEMFHMEH